jgi:flavodoxin
MKAIVLYWSKTGNTRKVAEAIQGGLNETGADVTLQHIDDASTLNPYNHDLVCLGFPSYQWSPPPPVIDFLRRTFAAYRHLVKVGAPPFPGKNVLIFCTYSGQHTGINEATPAVKFAGQFFEHLGIPVVDEWYVIGEFHGSLSASTEGRLGDIRGEPSEKVLADLKIKAQQLGQSLQEKNSSMDA